MVTECYAPVRGSAIRVTGLERNGAVPATVPYVVSKSVIKVSISEVSEGGGAEVLRNEEDERRLVIRRSAQTIRHMVDIDFVRVNPSLLSLVAGVRIVRAATLGFGEAPFGIAPFGGSLGDVVGFDAITKLPATSFALEVWTKLAGRCPDDHGYTVFPFLKGGRLSGFAFSNGLLSFNLRGAQTRRSVRWGRGPYALDGEPYTPLWTPVSGNTSWRQALVSGAPPTEICSIETFEDVIDGGTSSITSSDVIDGGTSGSTSAHVVDGGTS